MHVLLTILATTATTTAKKKSSSSSAYSFLIIIVLFAAVYFFFIRPRSQRMRQQQSASRSLAVGDEVVSAGGIYGTVIALDDNVAEVQVANGVVLTFLRRAISVRPDATPPPPPEAPEGAMDDDWPPSQDTSSGFESQDQDVPGDQPEQLP